MTNLEIIQQLNNLSLQINTLMTSALSNINPSFNSSNSNEITADNINDIGQVDDFFFATELKENSSIPNEKIEGEEIEKEFKYQEYMPEGEEII